MNIAGRQTYGLQCPMMIGSALMQKGETMKIKMTECITEIEADARELRESNTLANNFAMMLSRAFQNREPLGDEKEGEADETD